MQSKQADHGRNEHSGVARRIGTFHPISQVNSPKSASSPSLPASSRQPPHKNFVVNQIFVAICLPCRAIYTM